MADSPNATSLDFTSLKLNCLDLTSLDLTSLDLYNLNPNSLYAKSFVPIGLIFSSPRPESLVPEPLGPPSLRLPRSLSSTL
jgi:hypothetical protein